MASQARQQSGLNVDKAEHTFSIRFSLNGAPPEEVVVAPLTFTILEDAQRAATLKRFARQLEIEVQDLPESSELAAMVWTIMHRVDSTLTFEEVAGSISGLDVIPGDTVDEDMSDPS